MGQNIDISKMISWMRKNYWSLDRTNNHSVWIFYVEDPNDGSELCYGTLILNHHTEKGEGIKEYNFKQIADIMKISKKELRTMFDNKKNIDWKTYIKK